MDFSVDHDIGSTFAVDLAGLQTGTALNLAFRNDSGINEIIVQEKITSSLDKTSSSDSNLDLNFFLLHKILLFSQIFL